PDDDDDDAEAPTGLTVRLPPSVPRAMEELVALAREELVALAREEGTAADGDAARVASLRVRAALLLWDGRGDARVVVELGQPGGRPTGADPAVASVAAVLRRDLALDTDDDEGLGLLAEERQAAGDEASLTALASLGELLLLRRSKRALPALRAAGARGRET